MIERLKTAAWFLRRPAYWAHARELAARKVRPSFDTPGFANQARAWADAQSVSVAAALSKVGLLPCCSAGCPAFPEHLLREARSRVAQSNVKMGGAGDMNLLYAATTLSNARRIVETGVAFGWSSLAILAAIEQRADARLVSVDMPYPKRNLESLVGVAVPERLRAPWEILREPDRNGLSKAIVRLGGEIDLCHYDSDKSWWGRKFSYPLLWEALRRGGIFISDDIQDNLAFREFAETMTESFAVINCAGKSVGIMRKT